MLIYKNIRALGSNVFCQCLYKTTVTLIALQREEEIMCGICGIYNFSGSSFSTSSELIRSMNEKLSHRGPDDTGIFLSLDKKTALGHTRLSIIDLEGGHQPIHNEDGNIWIVCNGEIYNYQTLRQELLESGHRFATNSDTEVLLHLYEEMGEELLEKIDGMFAFALWDDTKKKLLIVRDRLGKKPLYYYVNNDIIVFASEIKAILQFPNIRCELRSESISSYFNYRSVPAPYTLFENIFKLKPGTFITCDRTHPIKEVEYWNVASSREDNSTDFCIQEESLLIKKISSELEHSVMARMVSDVPVGAFLSGGVDSSLIVAIMSMNSTKRISTFTIGVEEKEFCEYEYAKLVSDKFKTDHHELLIKKKDFFDFLPQFIYHFDDPVADPSAIPIYFISKLAKENGIKVMLSGEGSDEIFAGYPSYVNLLKWYEAKLRYFNQLPGSCKKTLFKLLSYTTLDKSTKDVLYKMAYSGSPYSGEATVFNYFEQKELLKDIIDTHTLLPHAHNKKEYDFVNSMLLFDINTRIPDDLLARTDRMTMATGLEARIPFLDHRLVSKVMQIPQTFKVKNYEPKYILKKVAEKILPGEIVYRKKMGFPIPVGNWLVNDYMNLFAKMVFENRNVAHLLNYSYINQLIDQQKSGKVKNGAKLFAILVFCMWHRYFIENREF